MKLCQAIRSLDNEGATVKRTKTPIRRGESTLQTDQSNKSLNSRPRTKYGGNAGKGKPNGTPKSKVVNDQGDGFVVGRRKSTLGKTIESKNSKNMEAANPYLQTF